MSRTLIDVDDEALARAASVLGTSTKVDTVKPRPAIGRPDCGPGG